MESNDILIHPFLLTMMLSSCDMLALAPLLTFTEPETHSKDIRGQGLIGSLKTQYTYREGFKKH